MVTAGWDRVSHGPLSVTIHLSRRAGLYRQPLQPTVCAVLARQGASGSAIFRQHTCPFPEATSVQPLSAPRMWNEPSRSLCCVVLT